MNSKKFSSKHTIRKLPFKAKLNEKIKNAVKMPLYWKCILSTIISVEFVINRTQHAPALDFFDCN